MRRLNVHKLVDSLNKLCITLEDNYDINCGGCCYVAYEIAKHLDRLNIRYQLAIANYSYLKKSAINTEIRSKRRNAKDTESVTGFNTCSHYFIKIDGGGGVNQGSWKDCPVYLVTEINHRNIQWIYRMGSWNDMYEKHHNKHIKKLISSHFKQYGKY